MSQRVSNNASQHLPESHDYFQAVLDSIDDPVLVLQRDFRVVHANQAARKLHDIGEQTLGEELCHQITHHRNTPCQSSQCRCPLVEVLRSKSPATEIHIHYDAEGNELATEVAASPVFDSRGEVVLVVEVRRDVTHLQRQARELEAMVEVTRSASSSLSLNDMLQRIVETTADVMRAKICTIRLIEGEELSVGAATGYENGGARNHRIKIDERIGRVIRDKQPLVIEDFLIAPDVPRRRIERARLEKVRSFVAAPVVSRDEAIGVLSIYKERAHKFSKEEINLFSTIAHQVAFAIDNARLFEQISRSKKDWESTFDAIDDSICIIGDDGEVLRVNVAAAKLLNKTFHECIGEKCYNLFHNTDQPHKDCLYFNGVKDGCAKSWELEDDRSGRCLHVSIFPRHHGNGDVVSTVHIVRDITEEKKIEGFLLRAQKMESLGTLAAGIAHEYNNIHQGIMGYVDLLTMNRDLPDTIVRELQRIRSLASRASDLASQLLLFSETGAIRKRAVDIHQLTDETIDILKGEFASEGIDVVTNYSDHIPELMIDASLMRQVIISIVINARHSMTRSENKILRIETGRSNGMVKIKISDTGHGIKKDNLEHVFDPFFTTKGALGSGEIFDGKIYGTGLGLSVSHAIVSSHGGMLTVESKEGRGTTFTISLPEPLAVVETGEAVKK